MSSSGPVGIGVETPARANQLRYKQAITVLPLFTGYAAYYFCRSDLSVAMPLLIEDLHRHGMSSNEAVIRLVTISSFGVLAYAVGKLFLTGGRLLGRTAQFYDRPRRRNRIHCIESTTSLDPVSVFVKVFLHLPAGEGV